MRATVRCRQPHQVDARREGRLEVGGERVADLVEEVDAVA